MSMERTLWASMKWVFFSYDERRGAPDARECHEGKVPVHQCRIEMDLVIR